MCTLGVKLQHGHMEKVSGIFQFRANYPFDLGLDSCCQNKILCNIFRAFRRNSGDLEEYCSGHNVIKCPPWCSFGGENCSTVSRKLPFMLENELTCQPSCFPRRLLFFSPHSPDLLQRSRFSSTFLIS